MSRWASFSWLLSASLLGPAHPTASASSSAMHGSSLRSIVHLLSGSHRQEVRGNSADWGRAQDSGPAVARGGSTGPFLGPPAAVSTPTRGRPDTAGGSRVWGTPACGCP